MTQKNSFVKNLKGAVLLLRPHHWIKNGFVLVPAFFGGQAHNTPLMLQALGAAFLFCLVSSLIYVFNDLRDVEADRLHAKKKLRPLASGMVSSTTALVLMVALVGGMAALIWALQPGRDFLAVLGLYIALNLAYSLGLKQLALAEIFLVSSGYILRLIAGAMIVNETLTHWIIACTGLVSLLLTVGKRRGDMVQNNDVNNSRRSLATYSIPYLDHVMTMLAACTIVTYLLFTMSDYAHKRFGEYVMLSAVFVLFGIMRYLQ
ncbi:MAG TPA: UbiA prenyltransferase family protein, partial [Alphaproteobacteria bacterium]|nr:UbiA prenyltransferase family protein [Alphaproteobacteria bacterium]